MNRMLLPMAAPMCSACLSGVSLCSQGRLGWMHWGAHLRSSGVPRASRQYTLTGSCCPWRCARSSACSRMATSSGSSTNTTLLAAVKSRPTPAGYRADWRGVSHTECIFMQNLTLLACRVRSLTCACAASIAVQRSPQHGTVLEQAGRSLPAAMTESNATLMPGSFLNCWQASLLSRWSVLPSICT